MIINNYLTPKYSHVLHQCFEKKTFLFSQIILIKQPCSVKLVQRIIVEIMGVPISTYKMFGRFYVFENGFLHLSCIVNLL